MLAFRDFITAFRKLEIDPIRPVIVHASLSVFGDIHGGAEAVLGALSSVFSTLIMPAFTYKTMITPAVGPPDNAIRYGSDRDANQKAEIYRYDMPVDAMMGVLAESLRTNPRAVRSSHPILSFSGIYAKHILDAQTLLEPLLPLKIMTDEEGWVLLLGVDHTVNTSIHYGEQLAGRKQFIRWALTSEGIIPCRGFPGCSDGFNAIASHMDGVIRKAELGKTVIQAIPLTRLVEVVSGMLEDDPVALLCNRTDCERCNAVRDSIPYR